MIRKFLGVVVLVLASVGTASAAFVNVAGSRGGAASPPPSGGDWQLAEGHYVSAKMSMVPAAPRAGLSTSNVYYVAHPAMPYQLPIVVHGGARPLHYELPVAPSGMTVDAATGIMTWSSPTTSGSPHSVTAEICDQEDGRPSASCVTVSWTITVQTSGFVFVSPTGSDAAAGTISAPKTPSATTLNATASTDIVVMRQGSTLTWDTTYNDNARRFMAYPGETATIDYTAEQTSGAATNRAWISLTILPKSSTGGGAAIAAWDSGETDILVYGCTFPDPGGESAIGFNPAFFFSVNNSPAWTEYLSFSDNVIEGTGHQSIFLGYSARYMVAQRNDVNGNQGHGWSAKIRNQYWSIMENTGLTGNASELVNFSDYDVTDSIEIGWNNYATTGEGLLFENGNGDASGATNVWVYRNTWQIPHHQVQNDGVNPLVVENDVTEYTTVSADPHGWNWESTPAEGTYSGEECVGRNTGIVNAAGILQGAFATACLGIRGHVAQ